MSISLTHGWNKMKVNLFFFFFMLAPWPSTVHLNCVALCPCLSFTAFYTYCLACKHLWGIATMCPYILIEPPCPLCPVQVSSENLDWKYTNMGWIKDTHTFLYPALPLIFCVCCTLCCFSVVMIYVSPPLCIIFLTTSMQSTCKSLQNSHQPHNLIHCPLPNICSVLQYVCNQKKGQLKYVPVSFHRSCYGVFHLQAECLLTARSPVVCWGCVAGLWSSSLLYSSRMRLTLCTYHTTFTNLCITGSRKVCHFKELTKLFFFFWRK